MLQHVSALSFSHHQVSRTFLACTVYASTYVVGIVHVIIIIIIIIIMEINVTVLPNSIVVKIRV